MVYLFIFTFDVFFTRWEPGNGCKLTSLPGTRFLKDNKTDADDIFD